MYTGAAGLNSSIATGGCSVLIQWNSGTYSEYFISIRDKKDTNYFNIETNSNVFTFGEARPGQEYKIIWYPIKNRKRIENLTEEITVLVPSGMFTFVNLFIVLGFFSVVNVFITCDVYM